jgi:hypothetical protein
MELCLGIIPNGEKCKNIKEANRGDYCNKCWVNGWRPPCLGYNLDTKVSCKLKAKIGNYCGQHINFEKPRCLWIINKGEKNEKRCISYQKKNKYCDKHFEIVEARKRRETKINYFMETLKIKIVVYSKEEYEILEKKRNYIEKQKKDIYSYKNEILNNSIVLDRKEDLIVIKYPICIEEWDYIQNTNIDIKKMTFGSGRKCWWVCNNSEHPSYLQKINLQVKGTKCKECRLESIGRSKEIREKEMKNIKNRIIDKKYNTTNLGDQMEEFVVQILNKINLYQSVKKLGEMGGKSDIEVVHKNGEKNYIQVKVLTEYKNIKTQYSINIKNYPDDMLIAGINKEKTHFIIEFAKRFKNNKTVTFPFQSERTKYKDIMYYDLDNFLIKMIELIPLSSKENEMNETSKKENKSFQRLSEICKQYNLVFKRNTTNGNPVDGFINGFKIQGKYKSKMHGLYYKIDIKKSAGIFNGKRIRAAYQEKDFDFLIIEVGMDKSGEIKHHNNFCIIPMEKLIKKKLIRNEECDGKTSFNICPPNCESEHWTKEYWNNFSQLI